MPENSAEMFNRVRLMARFDGFQGSGAVNALFVRQHPYVTF